jgi:hypothetical protein
VRKATLAAAIVLLVIIPAGAGTNAASRPPSRTCPVTLPNGGAGYHGNSGLSTALWTHNVVIADSRFIQGDGSVKMKFPWWRRVRGELEVTGRRLDARARPLAAEIAAGYGPIGLQPTYLIFPTAGCWRVTGRVGTATLTFVTLVVKAPYLVPRPG